MKDLLDSWKTYVTESSQNSEEWKSDVYNYFRKDLAHTWAFNATQQVVELVEKEAYSIEEAIKEVDEKL